MKVDECDLRMGIDAKKWDHKLLVANRPDKTKRLKRTAGEWK